MTRFGCEHSALANVEVKEKVKMPYPCNVKPFIMPFELLSKIVDQYDVLKYELLHALTFKEEHYGFEPICYKIMGTGHREAGGRRLLDRNPERIDYFYAL